MYSTPSTPIANCLHTHMSMHSSSIVLPNEAPLIQFECFIRIIAKLGVDLELSVLHCVEWEELIESASHYHERARELRCFMLNLPQSDCLLQDLKTQQMELHFARRN